MRPLNGRRIQIVGHAGAGKSVFSENLGRVLHIKVAHLDQIFWNKDWTARSFEEAKAIVRSIADEDEWIIDGNQWVPLKDITYPKATDILWVDPPFYIWLYRLLSRAIWKSLFVGGSFRKDFMSSKTSIIAQALRLRRKKAEKWEQRLAQDNRWQQIRSASNFLALWLGGSGWKE